MTGVILKSTLFILSLLAASGALADTTLVPTGNVSGVWTREGSPYIVTGQIDIPDQATLAITVGVRVIFLNTGRLTIGNGATLTATGAAGDSIYFTTDRDVTYNWYGIRSENNGTLQIDYGVIEYARGGPGAITIVNGTATVRNSTIRECVADYIDGWGIGAIFGVRESQIEFDNCDLVSNFPLTATVHLQECTASVSNCNFLMNQGPSLRTSECPTASITASEFVDNLGGGIRIDECDPVIQGCTFRGNIEAFFGGGIHSATGNPQISDCTFENNRAQNGGGIYLGFGEPLITECVFSGNRAERGGGVYLAFYPRLDFTRCTLIDNSATLEGSAIYFSETIDFVMFLSCIIAYHDTIPAIWSTLNPFIWNERGIFYCSLFENSAGDIAGPAFPSQFGTLSRVNLNGDSCDAFYNLYEDPLLEDVEHGDYYLTPNSVCIDGGPSSIPPDPDGTRADIGAFYYDQTPVGIDPPVIREFALLQNYPNPFNATTTIRFALPHEARVELKVFDLMGREIARLVDGEVTAGNHAMPFDAQGLASGIYFYRLNAGAFQQTRKLALIR